nr:GDP-mannose 3,5-epimerase 2 [Tanacetum cinerariifolium]
MEPIPIERKYRDHWFESCRPRIFVFYDFLVRGADEPSRVKIQPKQPQDAYGLEKLATEELCRHYTKDFGIECRIGRFHNIYGPFGTWKGGREKAPAAFCRKALTATDKFEMWGDGLQTRSFTFIDECVEGVLRLTKSDFREPVNIGSDEMDAPNNASILLYMRGEEVQDK